MTAQQRPLPRGELGLNYNGQLAWIDHEEIRQMGAAWVRGFIDMQGLPHNPAEDRHLAALLGAADAGFRTILSLKWDYAARELPGPDSAGFAAARDALDRVLRAVAGRVDVLVLGNEPFVETRPAQAGEPLNVFYEALADAAIRFFFHAGHAAPAAAPRLYMGALNRLDLPARRTPAVQRMLRFTASRPELDGVDLHPHMREPGGHETMVRWALARLRPDQTFLATEFSLVWCWKAHMGDVAASAPHHPDLPAGARVHEVLDAAIRAPVSAAQWRGFLAREPWYAARAGFLRDAVRLYRGTGHLAVATYPYCPMRERARPLGPDGVPWLLNGVYAPSTVRREPGAPRPEGFPWAEEFRCAVAEGG